MTWTSTPYTVYAPLPFDLVQGVASQDIELPVYRDGDEVVCTAATISVQNASGSTVATSASALSGTRPTLTVTAADVASESYGDGWLVTASIETTDGDILTGRWDCSLCRSHLYPVVTDQDLYGLHAGLQGDLGQGSITVRTTLETSRAAAWVQIMHRLREAGSRADLLMSPSSLRSVTLFLSAAIIFADLSSADPRSSSYWEQSQFYMAEYEKAWLRLDIRHYDHDNDGLSDGSKSGTPSIWFRAR